MAGNLSPGAQQELNTVREFLNRLARIHGLVELYATVKTKPEQYEQPLRRGFEQLKREFMGAGYDALSQVAGSMVLALRRSGPHPMRARALREGVGAMRQQLELESRAIVSADMAEQEKKKLQAEQ